MCTYSIESACPSAHQLGERRNPTKIYKYRPNNAQSCPSYEANENELPYSLQLCPDQKSCGNNATSPPPSLSRNCMHANEPRARRRRPPQKNMGVRQDMQAPPNERVIVRQRRDAWPGPPERKSRHKVTLSNHGVH